VQRLTRRDFLQGSAALAASVAATLGEPAPASEPAEKSPDRTPAADVLRVAVIGVHGRGLAHVDAFSGNHGCVVATICDADSAVIGKAMKAVEERQKKPARFEQDLRKVMDDRSIDIVSIATPNHWHALAAIWAMQAGKDVYLEKPVSHNVSEGRRIVEAASKYQCICQAGTQSRSAPGMREAIAFLQAGKLGKVQRARGICYKVRPSIGKVDGEQPVPATVNYDLWCGPAPRKPLRRRRLHYDWHWLWDYGNGDLGNQGIHEMDKARWGLAKNELPRAVHSLGGRFGYVDDGETPNTQICVYDYGDCELLFEVRGWPSKSPFPGKASPKDGKLPQNFIGNIWYAGDGFLVCPSYNGGVAYDLSGEVIKKFDQDGDHFGNFIQAVRSRKKQDLNADILEGHLSSALCHLGNISYLLGKEETFTNKPDLIEQNGGAAAAFASLIEHLKVNKIDIEKQKLCVGRKLKVNPTEEKFIDDQEAAALLTREYRKGFEVPKRL
jgi:predicted dehydrogenase